LQAVVFYQVEVLDSRLIGGAIALVLGGNALLFWTITDARDTVPPKDPAPDADEYDRMFDEVEANETGTDER